jgi:hypothetical protein
MQAEQFWTSSLLFVCLGICFADIYGSENSSTEKYSEYICILLYLIFSLQELRVMELIFNIIWYILITLRKEYKIPFFCFPFLLTFLLTVVCWDHSHTFLSIKLCTDIASQCWSVIFFSCRFSSTIFDTSCLFRHTDLTYLISITNAGPHFRGVPFTNHWPHMHSTETRHKLHVELKCVFVSQYKGERWNLQVLHSFKRILNYIAYI